MNTYSREEDTTADGPFIHRKSNAPVDEGRHHPVAQSLRAMVRTETPWRVVKACVEASCETRYAIVMLAPANVLRRQVVVLIDWSRSAKILPIALPAY